METVAVMVRGYEMSQSYWKDHDDGKLGQRDARMAKIEKGEPYVLCEGITIKIDKPARSAAGGLRKSLKAIFASGLMRIL